MAHHLRLTAPHVLRASTACRDALHPVAVESALSVHFRLWATAQAQIALFAFQISTAPVRISRNSLLFS